MSEEYILYAGGRCAGKSKRAMEQGYYKPFPKPILTDDTATLRRALVSYCQSCGRGFTSPELVYYAPLDGNIVCQECGEIHRDKQVRIFVREE